MNSEKTTNEMVLEREIASARVRKPQGVGVWIADAALVLCALLWGLGFVVMKNALAVYPTWWVLFFRFSGGTLLVGACFFKSIVRLTREDLRGGAVIGVFLFLAMGSQSLGLNYTTAGKQAFLTAGYVIMVPLVVWGLRRIFPGWLSIVSSLVCFAGMGLLTSDTSEPLNIGDVLTIVCALFYAAQIIAIGHYSAKGNPMALTFVQMLVTAALSFCSAMLFNGPPLWKGSEGVLEIFYSTFFSTFLCYLIQNVAQKHTSATHASILLGLESVFGVLSGVVFLNEIFTLQMFAGC
ncbi:MAG: DMT family transporter, partial [Synergistaceae bacterium]|nr:DMT family transporter [Synergistaceae bacterium]